MSYESPAPQAEEPTEDEQGTGATSPADPADVDPSDGTNEKDAPVDNPAG